MFKKIKDFISNHKTACLGIFLGFLCLVAIFLPKYLQNKRFMDSTIDNANITYTFDNTAEVDNVDSISVNDTITSQHIVVEPIIAMDSTDEEDIKNFISLFLDNYTIDSFNDNSLNLFTESFSCDDTLKYLLDYVLRYENWNYNFVSSNSVKFTKDDNFITITFMCNNTNQFYEVDYDTNLDATFTSLENLSKRRAVTCKVYDNIYLDKIYNIYYINYNDDYIVTSEDLVLSYLQGTLDLDSLVQQSQGLSVSSFIETEEDVLVDENVSSEEVEN